MTKVKKIKHKTNKSAAKRFKITKSGKIIRKKAGLKHLLEHKSSKSKRLKGKAVELAAVDAPRIRLLLPHG